MTQAEQNPNPKTIREVFRHMQVRMRNYAMHHFNQIGVRSMVALQDLDLAQDLLDESAKSFGSGVDLDVLHDPKHTRRVPLPSGPLLVYVNTNENPKPSAIEVPLLLFSDIPDVRRAALGELERMITAGEMDITPRTRKVLENTRSQVASDSPHEWRPAAIALTDALGDDVLVSLQGVRQSLECKPVIPDSLNMYVPRVLHPTMSSLDSIALDVQNPESEHPSLTEIVVKAVADASSLRDACARYYARLGYLPLAPAYSMAEVAARWLAAHPDTDVWTEVRAWANSEGGPIPRYHACAVFVLHPKLVPTGKLPDLWREILAVVHGDSDRKGVEDIKHEPWALRRDLAQHFARHLEAHIPDNDGANIACFAWWFAECVARLFSNEPEEAKFYRKNWVEAAETRSAYIWMAASPHIGRSYLRYLTQTITAPWATALLALMAGKLQQLAPEELPKETQTLLHEAFVSCLLGALPVVVEPVADPTYAQECPLGQTAFEWATHQPDNERKALEQLVAISRTLGSANGLCEALRKLAERSFPDQLAVAFALKAKAYYDPTIAVAVWEVLSDTEWRQRVLGSVEDQVLGILIEGFILLQSDAREKWFTQLPHFIADLCEKAEDRNRCRQLFLYTLHASLAADTVSAVRRLLLGDKKALISEFAANYRARVESMWPQYPAWIQGRLRGLFASMQVSIKRC